MGTSDAILPRNLAQAWAAYGQAGDVRAHHVACVLTIRGRLDHARFAAALHAVEDRHEALRGFVRAAKPTDHEHVPYVGARQPGAPRLLAHTDELAVERGSDSEAARAAWTDAVVATRLDLGNGWAHVRLARSDDELHTCVLVAARLACDDRSLAVVADDLVAAYAAPDPASAFVSQPSPPSLLAWLVWMGRREQAPHTDEAVAAAVEHLRGIAPAIELPLDHARPVAWSGRGRRVERPLDAAARASLERLAGETGVAHEALVLTAWLALLQRLANQDDVVLGVASAFEPTLDARASAGEPTLDARVSAGAPDVLVSPAAPLVGPCTTFALVRPTIARTLPLRSAIARIETELVRARVAAHAPLQRIVDSLGLVPDPTRTPLFQVGFEARVGGPGERPVAIEHARADVVFSRGPVLASGARTDCLLRFAHESDAVTLGLEYASDLLDEPSAVRFLEALAHAIAAMPAYLDEPLGRLPILTPRERTLALAAVRVAPFDSERPAYRRFASFSRTDPDAVAVVMNAESVCYGELALRATRLAHRLVHRGVVRESLVGIYCERSVDMLVAMLAIHEAGGAYVPLDPSHPPARIAAILEDAIPSILLTDQASYREAQRLVAATGGTTSPLVLVIGASDESASEPSALLTPAPIAMPPVAPDALAYVIFTSGSTGRPKGVEITHRAFTNFLESMAEAPGMTRADRILAVTTPSFDIAGLELMLPLFVGASLEIADRATCHDAERLAARLDSPAITMLQATPTTYRMLVESGWAGSPKLRVLCGGEPFPPDLARALLARVAAVWNVYGPTETTVWSTTSHLDREAAAGSVISVGRPIANTAVYLLDTYGEPVPVGAVGEIWIGGEGVARGYRGQPELTAERFVRDPFAPSVWPDARMYRTGDLGRFAPDGTLFCLGRVDFQVKIRGFRIELGDIEHALLEPIEAPLTSDEPLARVVQAVVVARDAQPHESSEKILVAYVVLDRADEAASAWRAAVREALRAKLPPYMIPSTFVVLEALPLNPSGKIDRAALPPPPDARTSDPGAESATPTIHRDDVEATIAAVFADLLGARDADPEASFFELGGNSLLAVRLVRQLELALGVTVPLASVFERPTIRALAGTIRAAEPVRDTPSVVVLRRGTSDESLFCISGVALYQHLARAMPSHVTVYGVYVPAEAGIFELGRLGGDRPSFVGVDELAATYVEVIRRTSPRGPYRLAGVSFGGIVAHAVAQKLHALGEEVQLLALLDALLPVALPGHPVRRVARSAWGWLRNREWRGAVGKLARTRFGRAADGLTDRELEALRDFVHEIEIVRYFRRMTPYAGDVVVFSALDRREYGDLAIDAATGWGDVVRGTLARYDVPGGHLAILEPPNVAVLAEHLAAHMR